MTKFASGFFKDEYCSVQPKYETEVKQIVQNFTKKIVTEKESNADMEALFDTLLFSFGTARRKLAQKLNAEDAEAFGRFRDGSSKYLSTTPLSGPYDKYNQPLLERIIAYLSKMDHDVKSFTQKELEEQEKPYMGKRTSIKVIIRENASDFIGDLREEYKYFCKKIKIKPMGDKISIQDCYDHLMRPQNMAKMLKTAKEDYDKLKWSTLAANMRDCIPQSRMSKYVFATQYYEINGEMCALTEYVTYMYARHTEDPVQYMTDRPDGTKVILCHQDVTLIPHTLKEIAKLFKQAIEWDGKDISELQNLLALFNYLFAHAMPFDRGSAAVCEWFEMSMLASHGIDLEYKDEVSINLEALTLPLETFIAKYPSMIDYSKNEPASIAQAKA